MSTTHPIVCGVSLDPPDTLRALPWSNRRHRYQNEVLRRLLRVQGMPRDARQPRTRCMAGERMERDGDPLWGVPERTDHPAVYAVRVSLPGMPRAIQSWLPEPLSLLLPHAAARRNCGAAIGRGKCSPSHRFPLSGFTSATPCRSRSGISRRSSAGARRLR